MSVVVLLALTACAAPPSPSPAAPAAPGAETPAQVQRPAAPKILTFAIQTELKGFVADLALENSRIGGVKQPKSVVHNLLTVENARQEWVPELAAEPLSVDRGTWKVNADGTMETTWKIRPNVKWHDGTPFTSEDLLFAWRIITDRDIPNQAGPAVRLMTAATAPDPLTLVVQWSSPYVDADRAIGLAPLPKHLLEDTYLNDKANFINSPRLSTEFVGLGPYKLVHWESGSHLELARFDDYWRGRPPLDRVFVRFIGDPNTMVSNILAESIDVVLGPAVDLEAALELKRRWEGTGHQVLVGPSGTVRFLAPQHRAEFVRPQNATTNVLVRQALYHAMDRQALVDTLTDGLAPVADSWFAPNDPLRPELETSIPKYPFDLRRAQDLLAQAGWTRGSDGVLVHQPSGERMELEINGGATKYIEREQNIIADGWKQVGAQVTLFNIPPALANQIENRAVRPGPGIYAGVRSTLPTTFPHSRQAPSAQNRWTGGNFGGYSNPRVDAILDQIQVTIPVAQRLPLLRESINIAMMEVAVWPMYWDVTSVMALKTVKGISGGEGTYHTWNFFEWDKE